MKKGNKIKLFEDPITCLKLEGIALLQEFISKDCEFETWKVLFDGKYESPVTRRIKK